MPDVELDQRHPPEAAPTAPRAEDEFGLLKRLRFFDEIVSRHRPSNILDVGCGLGNLLTEPVARRHPEIEILGVDDDPATIRGAREVGALPNLSYAEEIPAGQRFEMIWASEVLEHVEDPAGFLIDLRERLTENGRLLVTVPNGYGPFEIGALIETALIVTGGMDRLRSVFAGRDDAGNVDDMGPATLAISPHLNFFAYSSLLELFENAGLGVDLYRPRTFLCGFGFGTIVRRAERVRWNAAIAERLPPQVVSGWMFVLSVRSPATAPSGGHWRRGPVGRVRRWLNERRWLAG
jgi:SAM-dependent methyltransferase